MLSGIDGNNFTWLLILIEIESLHRAGNELSQDKTSQNTVERYLFYWLWDR